MTAETQQQQQQQQQEEYANCASAAMMRGVATACSVSHRHKSTGAAHSPLISASVATA